MTKVCSYKYVSILVMVKLLSTKYTATNVARRQFHFPRFVQILRYCTMYHLNILQSFRLVATICLITACHR